MKTLTAQRATHTHVKTDGSYVAIQFLGEDGEPFMVTLPYEQADRFRMDLFKAVEGATALRIKAGIVPAAQEGEMREVNTYRVLTHTSGESLLLEILSSPTGEHAPTLSRYSLTGEQSADLSGELANKSREAQSARTRN